MDFKKIKKFVAKVTLVAMCATLLPTGILPTTEAEAASAPATISLSDHGYGSKGNVDYTSTAGLGSCTVHFAERGSRRK